MMVALIDDDEAVLDRCRWLLRAETSMSAAS